MLRVLYHGTDIESAKEICTVGINVNCSQPQVDFGSGFYTTDDLRRAKIWAIRKAKARKSKPAIVKVYFDEAAAESIIVRFQDDLRWGRFVINNRNGRDYISKVSFQEHNLDREYQITIGRIADVRVAKIARKLDAEERMLESLTDIFNSKYPQQIVFHTQYATTFIRKLSYRYVRRK